MEKTLLRGPDCGLNFPAILGLFSLEVASQALQQVDFFPGADKRSACELLANKSEEKRMCLKLFEARPPSLFGRLGDGENFAERP